MPDALCELQSTTRMCSLEAPQAQAWGIAEKNAQVSRISRRSSVLNHDGVSDPTCTSFITTLSHRGDLEDNYVQAPRDKVGNCHLPRARTRYYRMQRTRWEPASAVEWTQQVPRLVSQHISHVSLRAGLIWYN